MEEASRGASTSGELHSGESRQTEPANSVSHPAINNSNPTVVTLPHEPTDPHVVSTSSGTWLCCVPCYWLRSNNSVHKASLTVVTLLVTSLLVASPVLFLISSVPGGDLNKDCLFQTNSRCIDDSETRSHHICEGVTCKILANQILSNMDRQKAPCQNFYKFACGNRKGMASTTGSLSLSTIEASINTQLKNFLAVNATSWPFLKLNKFYNSCLQIKNKPVSTGPLFKLLEESGGYLPPNMLGPSDLTPLLVKLLQLNGIGYVDILMHNDFQDKQQTAIYIDLPRPNSATSLLFSYSIETNQENVDQLTEKLIDEFLPSKMIKNQRDSEKQNIVTFISMFDKIYHEMLSNAETVSLEYGQKYNLTRLQSEFPFINWEKLIFSLFFINVTDADIIYVVNPAYLTKLEELTIQFQKRIIHNSMLIKYARDIYANILSPSTKELPLFCSQLTARLFSESVGALYIQQFPLDYLSHITNKLIKLFQRVKETLMNRMKIINWIDVETSKMATAKLQALKAQYLTWPVLFNLTHVADTLKNINIDTDTFYDNVINRFQQLRLEEIKSNKQWPTTFSLKMNYIVNDNLILIPTALLTQIYFRNDLPDYVMFATIGNILTHEIIHAFDLNGINFDGNGSKKEWFTPDSRLRLEARIDCVARQYMSIFKDNKPFSQYYWNTTRNENIADIGALQIIYQTWSSKIDLLSEKNRNTLPGISLNTKQLFFLILAQMYCTNKATNSVNLDVNEIPKVLFNSERLNGIMMNSPSFSEAFNCALGTPMNPPKKCSTW